MTGIIMLLPTYDIANRATNPRINIDALANNGSFNLSSVTAYQDSHFFYEKHVEKESGLMT